MKILSYFIIALYNVVFLHAEILFEFDGEKWQTTQGHTASHEKITEAYCYKAEAKVKMKQASSFIRQFAQSPQYPIRVALLGQEGNGASFEPLPPGAKNSDLWTFVTCDPKGIDIGNIKIGSPKSREMYETALMSADFEGLDRFLAVIKAHVRRAELAGVSIFVSLNVRSETSWGQMVRVLQIIRSAGCRYGTIRIDDQIPGCHMEVNQEVRESSDDHTKEVAPNIKLPNQGNRAVTKSARIVINILANGQLKNAAGKVLGSSDEVAEYVDQERKMDQLSGLKSVLFLRGDEKSVTLHAARVLEAAAKKGVTDVIYATFPAK